MPIARLGLTLLIMLAATALADAENQKLKTQLVANLKALSALEMPHKYRGPLAVALPPKVRITTFNMTLAKVTIRGEAASFDSVSEFMRGLNNVVVTVRGQGRVVERKRDGNLRVELTEDGAVFEFSPSEMSFIFAGLELGSTTAGPPVAFELTMLLR